MHFSFRNSGKIQNPKRDELSFSGRIENVYFLTYGVGGWVRQKYSCVDVGIKIAGANQQSDEERYWILHPLFYCMGLWLS